MKSHTSEFKEEIKTLGKQQSVRITYKENNVTKTLTDEDINSVTPNYEANLLKSVMKALELDSNISIPKDTEIKFEYGLLVNGAYEYLNYGNYIVAKEPEKQEDTLSYKITCYDKMLYSMKDYEHIEVNYPCKIKKFLIELCKKIGLEFKDSTFANQDREFANELFMTINEDGTYSSMGYTYRDVLDQIAETTGGCICITLDDKVEVRYINKALEYSTSKNTNEVKIETQVKEKVKTINIEGNSYQETTEGYNLFDKSTANIGKVINAQGELETDSGVGFSTSDYIQIEPNTNYYLYNVLPAYYVRTCGIYDDNKGFIKAVNLSGSNVGNLLILTPANAKYIRITYKTSDVDIVQVTKGINLLPYEPYTGKMPSPSPDYPQKITNVGENGIKIKQSGKNLLNVPEVLEISIFKEIEVNLEANNTYTFKFDNAIAGSDNNISMISFRNTKDIVVKNLNTSIVKKFEIQPTQDITNIRIYASTDYSSSVGKIKTFQRLMIYEGTDDTSYEPYHEPIITPINLQGNILSKVGDVKDILKINRNGEVEIKKNIGKLVLDGTEDWHKDADKNGETDYFYIYKSGIDSSNIANVISNRFVKGNDNTEGFWATSVFCITINKTRTGIVSSDNTVARIQKFKTWLSQHPTEVYYKLATPQTISLPSISPIELWQGTNIFSLVTNLDTEIELEYPTNYDTIDEEYINDTNVNFGEKYRAN